MYRRVRDTPTGFESTDKGWKNNEGYVFEESSSEGVLHPEGRGHLYEYEDTRHGRKVRILMRYQNLPGGKSIEDGTLFDRTWDDGTPVTSGDLDKLRSNLKELNDYFDTRFHISDEDSVARDLSGERIKAATTPRESPPPVKETPSSFRMVGGGWKNRDGFYFGPTEQTDRHTLDYIDSKNDRRLTVIQESGRLPDGERCTDLSFFSGWSDGSRITDEEWSQFKRHLEEINEGWPLYGGFRCR